MAGSIDVLLRTGARRYRVASAMLRAAPGHGMQLATERAGALAEEVERLWRANGWRARQRRRIVPQFTNRRRDRLSPFAGLKQRAEDRIGRLRGMNRTPWPKFLTANPQFAPLCESIKSIIEMCLAYDKTKRID